MTSRKLLFYKEEEEQQGKEIGIYVNFEEQVIGKKVLIDKIIILPEGALSVTRTIMRKLKTN